MTCTFVRNSETGDNAQDVDDKTSDGGDDFDSLHKLCDVPLLVVLSEGITKCRAFSIAVENALDTGRELHFVYATRRPDFECEWEFNGKEVKHASSIVQDILAQSEAIPFRWPESTARYEQDAMARELLRRIQRGKQRHLSSVQ